MKKKYLIATEVIPLENGKDVATTPGYDIHGFLNGLSRLVGAKNDADLSRTLKLAPHVVSKLRHKRLHLSPGLILRVHDVTGLEVKNIRQLAGLPHPAKPELAAA